MGFRSGFKLLRFVGDQNHYFCRQAWLCWMRLFSGLVIYSLALLTFLAPAQAQVHEVSYQHRDAWQMESKELRVTVMQVGGHVAEIICKGGPEVNPLWLPG